MNFAGFLMLAFMACAAWACVKSDWQEFKEEPKDDDEDEHHKPENWGAK